MSIWRWTRLLFGWWFTGVLSDEPNRIFLASVLSDAKARLEHVSQDPREWDMRKKASKK